MVLGYSEGSYDLIESFGSAQSSGTGTNDQDIDIAAGFRQHRKKVWQHEIGGVSYISCPLALLIFRL